MIKHASVLIILRTIYLKLKKKTHLDWGEGCFAFKKIKYILKMFQRQFQLNIMNRQQPSQKAGSLQQRAECAAFSVLKG